MLLQYPGADGEVRDYRALARRACTRAAALVIVAADVLALTLLAPPGEWGADVVVGSTQRFGVPMGYGGPHAGYLATRDEFKRSLPGRLVGVTVDAGGEPAYRLALQTREQHIRREKATSNICTAQVLLAVIASMYAVYHGPEGLTRIARRVHRLDRDPAQAGLVQLGFAGADRRALRHARRRAPASAPRRSHARGVAAGVNFRRVDDATLGVSLDETTTRDDVDALWRIVSRRRRAVHRGRRSTPRSRDDAAGRRSRARTPFLTHPVFHRYRSETEMLRYLRRLADRDLALDRAMIPLGSCTMKLNATAEMIPVTWPEFGDAASVRAGRPGAGLSRADRASSSAMLCAVTGYDAVSLQPNAGSQGEYAGLLMIRAYHASRGEAQRDVCLIPASAHGTNPASAQMAGMQVVVVACDEDGNVDLADLEAKAAQHAPRARRDHGDLSVDARRVRGGHPAHLRDRARARRPGVRRRREPERAGRPRRARPFRRRRLAPQPAQDVLHSARRRRARRRARSP